jgi:hypothetical protein
MAKTELKIGEAGFGFATVTGEPGATTWMASPMPIARYRVRPRITRPAGPDGSLTSLLADGNPSRRVRRMPSVPTIEMRPLCRTPAVPDSDMRRFS